MSDLRAATILPGSSALPYGIRLIIHVHGAVFSLWIVLLIAQTSLVTAGRVDLHRRLGVLGFGLASLMVILDLWAATNSLPRGNGFLGATAASFYVIPVTDILTFAVLVFAAFRARFQPAAHKRLIIVATIALLGAAIARWPLALFHRSPVMIDVFSYMFLLLLAGYDRGPCDGFTAPHFGPARY
jgi:hypothetical protein